MEGKILLFALPGVINANVISCARDIERPPKNRQQKAID